MDYVISIIPIAIDGGRPPAMLNELMAKSAARLLGGKC